MNNHSVICFGEVLWDMLPSGKIAGGAPMNVAYRISHLNTQSTMISRVGKDELGSELLSFLQNKGLSTRWVQIDPDHSTGIVKVHLDADGAPSYEIMQAAAWDYIELTEDLLEIVESAGALVFGSLSCRTAKSRDTLFALIEKARLRVFDVNLREPFYTQALLEDLLLRSNIVKVNHNELEILAKWYGGGNEEATQMEMLLTRFDCDRIIVTKGPDGASCLSGSSYRTVPGVSVAVKDTIGSGDAFLSGFLYRYLVGADDQECLRYANALGALTATKSGGTPDISLAEIEEFLKHMPS